ncbi:inverse autotransporter beta domain-containing protein, partial [Gilvimarinus algae]
MSHLSSLGSYSSLGVLAAVLAGTPLVSQGADKTPQPATKPKWYSTTFYAGARLGDDRTIGELGLLVPVLQAPHSNFYADLRGRIDEDTNEFNLGLGYRQVLGQESFLLGGYFYRDRLESEYDNSFAQYTLGLEVQGPSWKLGFNHYEPDDDEGKSVAPAETVVTGNPNATPELVWEAQQLYFLRPGGTETVTQWREYALGGNDIELSYKLLGSETQELWLSGGYYRFDADGLDEKAEGPRAKIEWRRDIDVLPEGSRIELGLQWQDDDLRGDQSYLSFGIHIPLGGKSRSRGEDYRRWYEDRMTDRPVRDVDVITAAQNHVIERREQEAVRESVVFADGPWAGREVGSVVFASADGSGSGAPDSPTSFSSAVNGSGDGSRVVFVSGEHAGASVEQDDLFIVSGGGLSVRSADNNELIGVFGADTAGAEFTDTVTFTGDDIVVQGVDFTGGLQLQGLNNFTLSGSDSGDVQLDNVSGDILFNDVNFSGLHATGGSANFVHASGSLHRSTDGFVVDLAEVQGGQFTFQQTVSAASMASGVRIHNLADTSVAFSGLDFSGIQGPGVLIGGESAATASSANLQKESGTSIQLGSVVMHNTAGNALEISGDYQVSAGAISLSDIGGSGLVFAGATGSFTSGAISISNVAQTGLDFTDSNTAFSSGSLSIAGANVGIDLTRSSNSIDIANGALSGFGDVGVQFNATDTLADTAGSQFTMGGGSIAAAPGSYVLDAIGLDENSGLYDFTGVAFDGEFLFDLTDAGEGLFYVAANATGSGDGSSSADLASIETAQAYADSSASDVTFVLVNDGNAIDVSTLAGGSFVLGDGQGLASFNDDHTSEIGIPKNLIGDFGSIGLKDPTGHGTATLTGGTGSLITLGNNNVIEDIILDGGSSGLFGDGIEGLVLSDAQFLNTAGYALNFSDISGVFTLTDLVFEGNQSYLLIDGSSADFTADGFTASANGGPLLSITGQTGGSIQLGQLQSVSGNSSGSVRSQSQSGGSLAIAGIEIAEFSGNAAVSFTGRGNVSIGDLNLNLVRGDALVADGVRLQIANGGSLRTNNGAVLALSDVNASGGIRLGDLYSRGSNQTAVLLEDVSGDIDVGNIDIVNPSNTGISFEDFSGDFTARSLDISGGDTAIDLTDSGGDIVIAQGGVIQSFSGVGVQFNRTGSLANSANADFRFGGGTITASGSSYVMDAMGLDETRGTYNFSGVSFTGDFLFAEDPNQVGDLFFVASTATGDGSGSDENNYADVATAQIQASTGDLTTFVFVNDGSAIDVGAGGFTLSDGQVVSGFGNDNSFGLLVPENLIGDFSGAGIEDPTGNGAAMLTGATGAVLNLANANLVEHITIGSAVDGIGALNITDA